MAVVHLRFVGFSGNLLLIYSSTHHVFVFLFSPCFAQIPKNRTTSPNYPAALTPTMAHTREALQRQLQVERASLARLMKWSDFQERHQSEMITKFGFSIEPVGMYEEELAQLGHDAELELLKKDGKQPFPLFYL